MKVTVWPQKNTVIGIINERISREARVVDESNTSLAELNSQTLFLGNHKQLEDGYNGKIAQANKNIEYLDIQRKLIEDNEEDGRVSVEIEL